MSLKTPQSVSTLMESPVHDKCGYDAIAATLCPGSSISGIISIPRFSAYNTISFMSFFV